MEDYFLWKEKGRGEGTVKEEKQKGNFLVFQ